MIHHLPRVVIFMCLAVLLVACSGPTEGPPDSDSVALEGGASDAGAEQGESAAAPVDAGDSGDGDEQGADAEADGAAADGDDTTADDADAGGQDPGADADKGEADDGDTAPVARPAATSIAEPISAITSTLTYIDSDIGYAIDYPETWTIDSASGSIVTLMSFDPAEYGGGGLMPQDSRVDIVPDLSEAAATTLPQLVALTAGAGTEISREELELEGGVPAMRLHLSSTASPTGEVLMLLAVIDGRGVRVQGFGNLTLFDPIARSLRPAEAE